MSEQETWVGKLREIKRLNNESDADYFTRVTDIEYIQKGFTPENIREAIYENCLDDNYICVNNIIYEVFDTEELNDTLTCTINTEKDNTFTFYTSFYNGGTCLNEMLEAELERVINGHKSCC